MGGITFGNKNVRLILLNEYNLIYTLYFNLYLLHC